VKDIHDLITHAKFGDDHFRGSGVVAGQISAFSIDFAGRPYNTLTLPCFRVIIGIQSPLHSFIHGFPRLSTVTSEYIRFVVFLFYTF